MMDEIKLIENEKH